MYKAYIRTHLQMRKHGVVTHRLFDVNLIL